MKTRRIIGAAIGALLALGAEEGAAQTGFVPYTVTYEQHQQLIQYLAQQPYAVAAPIVNTLSQWEADAQKAVAEAAEKAKAEKPGGKK